jgi:hypothetical protein
MIVFTEHNLSESTSTQNFEQFKLLEPSNIGCDIFTFEDKLGLGFGLF